MQIVVANPKGFRAGLERAIRAVERALDDFGAPEHIALMLPREPKRPGTLAAGARPAAVAPAVFMRATGAAA